MPAPAIPPSKSHCEDTISADRIAGFGLARTYGWFGYRHAWHALSSWPMTVARRLFALLPLIGLPVWTPAHEVAMSWDDPSVDALKKIHIFHPISLEQALTETVHRQLEIKIATWNIAQQKGLIQQAAAPFDPVLNDEFSAMYAHDVQVPDSNLNTHQSAQQFNQSLSVLKKTRLGTLISMELQGAKVHDKANFLAGNLANPRLATGDVVIRLAQPLLRGAFGWGLDAQREQAAKRELDAVKYDVLQTIAQKVLDTTLAYWHFVAAVKALKINADTSQRLTALKQKVARLIAAEEMAVADELQLTAALAIRQENQIALQFRLYAAMQQLLFAMGDTPTELTPSDCCFDQIIDVFPEYPEWRPSQGILPACNVLLIHALTHRFDIQSALIREEVAKLMLKGWDNETLAELNVFGEVKRSNFQVGDKAKNLSSALYMPRRQTDWTVGASFSIPLHNDRALGNYKQQYAIYHQRLLETQLIKEQTTRDLLVVIKNLTDLTQQIQQAVVAVQTFHTIIENETEKLRGGFGDLFVLIDFENRLNDALNLQNNLYLDWSQTLARLRFLSGSLLTIQDCDHIQIESPTTFPLVAPATTPSI